MNGIGTVCFDALHSLSHSHSHSRSPNALLLHEIYALLHTRFFPLLFWLIGRVLRQQNNSNTQIKYTHFSRSLSFVSLYAAIALQMLFINFEWRSKTTTAAAATAAAATTNNDKSKSKRLVDDDEEVDPTISNALFGYSYKIFCNKWHVLFSCTPSFCSLSHFCPFCIRHCHGT